MHVTTKYDVFYLGASALSLFVKQVKAGTKWFIATGCSAKRQELSCDRETGKCHIVNPPQKNKNKNG